MSNSSPQESSRIVGLDFVRICLALLIFLFHSRIHVSCNYFTLNAFINVGHLVAMTAFFMLSGYCLVLSSDRGHIINWGEIKTFYKKRFVAIYPLYFVAGYLGVIILILAKRQSLFDNALLLPIELLCIQSFFDSLFLYAHNSGTWFISCLAFCYFLFPFLNYIIEHLQKKSVILLLIVIILILSYSPFLADHFEASDNYSNPFFRFLEFTVGILLARVNVDGSFDGKILTSIRSVWAFIVSSLLLVLGISIAQKYGLYKAWIPVSCFVFILLGAGHIRFPSFFNNKVIRYCSKVSYAFYLGQMLVWVPLKAFIKHFWHQPDNFVLIVISFIACSISAILLHEFVEKPSRKWLV